MPKVEELMSAGLSAEVARLLSSEEKRDEKVASALATRCDRLEAALDSLEARVSVLDDPFGPPTATSEESKEEASKSSAN